MRKKTQMKQPEKEELDGGLEKQAEEETDTMEEKEIIDDEEEELAQVKTPEGGSSRMERHRASPSG